MGHAKSETERERKRDGETKKERFEEVRGKDGHHGRGLHTDPRLTFLAPDACVLVHLLSFSHTCIFIYPSASMHLFF